MDAPETPFPLKVAAIDVGSNAIRFVAAEFVDPRRWVELEYLRVPVRLGRGAFLTGRLEGSAMAATVETMAMFRRSLDTHGISRYRAVATSAVRESRNGGELVARVRDESGILLEAITGSEEARLVWTAARTRLATDGGPWIMADLGGGSLEISVASDRGLHWIESHTMGTVRLLEDLGAEVRDQQELARLIREYAGTLRIPRAAEGALRGLAATGGNIETMAELTGRAPDAGGISRLPVDELEEWIDRLASLPVEERIARLGLREDRADVILPAAILYHRVARLVGVEEVCVPHVGVKEGVLVDLVDDLTDPDSHADRLESEALHGALSLGRRYRFDESHARHVARLSLSLFDQLREVHGLGHADRRILLAAAVLHDVGQFVSHRRHHEHSLYLVHNSELPNFAPDEIPLVALVGRYHRRAEPKPEHDLFEDLGPEKRERVRRLAALLRVADALDREHSQRVTAVRVRHGPDEIVLDVDARGELLLERWALRKKARMFHSVYGVPVRLTVPAGSPGPAVI